MLKKIFKLKHRYDMIIELLNDFEYKGVLLDAGSGHGRISKKLKENGFKVIRCDICPQN